MASPAPTPAPQWLIAASKLLDNGDAQGAAAQLVAHGDDAAAQTMPARWLHARAARQLGDTAAEMGALHTILRHSPRELPALLAMADAFARQSDERAASSWYMAALRQAAIAPPPPALHPMLQRAQDYCQSAKVHFADHLQAELQARHIETGGSAALRHAIAMLTGRAQLFLQQPSAFYYPGLPQRCFFERHEWDWVAQVEAQVDTLRDELFALTSGKSGAQADAQAEAPASVARGGAAHGADTFRPYVERTDTRPAPNNPLLDDPAWSAAYLWKNGLAQDVAAQCPGTMAALALAGQPAIRARAPMALYSRLRPGAHIAPHHGMLNTRLICHLPLVAPDGCALRVGHETRPWRYGETLIFDDSMEHEAWNRGASERTVLLFEIWRPEIPAEDRIMLTHLFEAIGTIDPASTMEHGA
ncbi:MAG: aspartyl/asparaginyl beta-hydroxylase domain-containing protein [Sphingopyxis sp.]